MHMFGFGPLHMGSDTCACGRKFDILDDEGAPLDCSACVEQATETWFSDEDVAYAAKPFIGMARLASVEREIKG